VTHTDLIAAYVEVLQRAPLRLLLVVHFCQQIGDSPGKKKKDLSATMADDKGALCDLDPKNIIDMTDGDVPDAKRQAFEEYQKARREAEEGLRIGFSEDSRWESGGSARI
jgi:hypothetical protein